MSAMYVYKAWTLQCHFFMFSQKKSGNNVWLGPLWFSWFSSAYTCHLSQVCMEKLSGPSMVLSFKNVPVKFLVPDLLPSTSGITVQASRAVCFPVLFLLGLLQLLAVQLRREFLPFAQNKPVPTNNKVVGFDGQPCSGSYHLSYG